MSEVIKGVVTKLDAKRGQGKNGPWALWSFQLEGNRDYFSCGFKEPACKNGEVIKFSFDLEMYNGKEKKVVDIDSIQVLPQEESAALSSATSDKQAEKDKMWANKDKKIQLYGCREAAVNIVLTALKEGVLPEIPKAKKGEQFDLLLDMVDKVTDRYYQQAEALVAEGKEKDGGDKEKNAEADDEPNPLDD